MPTLPPAVAAPLLTAGTSVVRVASRLRGQRVIHARGRTLAARLLAPDER